MKLSGAVTIVVSTVKASDAECWEQNAGPRRDHADLRLEEVVGITSAIGEVNAVLAIYE